MINRPERLICFLVVWLTMFSFHELRGQVSLSKGVKEDFFHIRYPGTTGGRYGQNSLFLKAKPSVQGIDSTHFRLNLYSSWGSAPTEGLYAQVPDLFYKQSGYFCKREWDLEKTTHIPFRFRLGSLADCNALEGKH